MAIEVISTIKPKNNGDFPIVEAQDVVVDDKGTRLNDKLENMAVNTPTFDLTELILPSDGSAVSLEMDTTEIRAALDKGVVEFKITLNLTESISIPVSVIPSVVEVNDTTYSCSAFYNFDANARQGVINFMVSDTAVTVWLTGFNETTEEKPVATSIDLSNFDTQGQIVEGYADGSSKTTTLEFDADGNPTKITDGDGNVTTLIW